MNKSQKELVSSIIDDADDMSIATVRPDGFPQNTTVSYFNDGETIYFAASPTSQKAHNIAKDDRVSITINRPYESWNQIQGLSMGAHANLVTDSQELKNASDLLLKKFPQAIDFGVDDSTEYTQEELKVYRLEPIAISLLDYGRGFGHTEYVEY